MRPPSAWRVAPATLPLLLALAGCARAPAVAPLQAPLPPPDPAVEARLLGDQLHREDLVREVLARNPGLQAQRQAALAALQGPGRVAAPDPQVRVMAAPLSLVGTKPGLEVEVSQRLPVAGALRLRGEAALAEAAAASEDHAQAQLDLALAASVLFDDLLLVERALAINAEHMGLLQDLREAARGLYAAGRTSLQDPLSAEVELAHLEHRQMDLEAERLAVSARINALLHRAPQTALPSAATPDLPEHPMVEPSLTPSIRALQAGAEGARAETTLARRAFVPSPVLMASWSSMWDMPEHRLMVGLGVEVPVQAGQRRATLDAARARELRAELLLRAEVDRVAAEREVARIGLERALHVAELYRDRLLPLALDQVEAARAAYVAGRSPFEAVVRAERNLRDARLQLAEATAEAHRARAALERSLDRTPGLPEEAP